MESIRGRLLMSFCDLPTSVHRCMHLHIHIRAPYTYATYMPHSHTEEKRGEEKRRGVGEYEARQSLLKISSQGMQRKDLGAQHLRV